ncbi:alpha-ribazole-5'-phosphate phosphatase [Vibrio ponticus]|nr:alpha-ribazole-5'-phosphate phosphatase [Vibrio ponticus]
MRTVNFYLLRHGKVNGEPALYGRTDVRVAPEKQQAICQALLKQDLNIKFVVTSPLKRCADLADLVSQRCPDLAVQTNPGFQEIDFGQFDGVAFEELQEQWPLLEAFWQNPVQHPLPEAEPLAQFYQRISTAWQTLVEKAEGDTLLICHGGTIRMILAYVLGLNWADAKLFSVLQIGNQSLTHIKITQLDTIYPQVCAIGTPLETI